MQRYLVTGGAGFIGSNLCEALLARGAAVRILDDFSSGRRENIESLAGDLEVIEGDLREYETVRRAAEGVDGIFHEGAMPSVPRSLEKPALSNEVNIAGTLNVFLAARAARVRRVVFASSSSVYGNQAEGKAKVETMTPAPLSPYALQKLAGEHYGRIASEQGWVEVVSLRYFNVFGPRQDPKSDYAAVIPKFVTCFIRGERPTIFGDGTQSRDFTYIDNVVEANLLAMQAPSEAAAGEVFNVACGARYSLLDLVAELRKATGREIAPLFAPPRAGDIKHSLASIEKARRGLGFEPRVGFGEGLAKTLAWYRSRG